MILLGATQSGLASKTLLDLHGLNSEPEGSVTTSNPRARPYQ